MDREDTVENSRAILGPVHCIERCPSFVHALKNKSSTISGQNALNLSHLSAFELLDMLGDYLGQARFSGWIGSPYRSHFDG
jgi:hypothetical protein